MAAAPAAPVVPAATPASAPALDTPARLVRGAPIPPERPFDLATIPGAATPITVAGAGSSQPAVIRGLAQPTGQAERQVVASLYFAPPTQPAAGFSTSNPLARDLRPQRFVALSPRP
jgi:rare lipoprotein A